MKIKNSKITYLLLAAVLLFGCNRSGESLKYKPPCTIYDKQAPGFDCAQGDSKYRYECDNGYGTWFCDKSDAYSVGDTL